VNRGFSRRRKQLFKSESNPAGGAGFQDRESYWETEIDDIKKAICATVATALIVNLVVIGNRCRE